MSGEPGEAAAGEGYEDQLITCKDCSTEFTFTARAQAYFVEQGFPLAACVRCTWCKEQKRQKSAAKDAEQSGWADEGAGDTQGGEEGGAKKKKKKKKKEAEPSEASASWWDSMVEKNKDKTRCFNCGKKGHTSTDCPKEKGAVSGCYRCGSAEHRSRDCPTAVAAADAAKDRCFNCGASGHQAAECTVARGSSACYLCGKDGHQARYCRSAAAQAPKVDAAKVSELVAKRTELRAAGDYAGADAIRTQLLGMNVRLQDAESSWSTGPKRKKPQRVCFAFQKGECTRGDKCHFDHVEAPVEKEKEKTEEE